MFPARRCPATYGRRVKTVQNLDVVRIDEVVRGLLLVRGAVPAKNGDVVRARPKVKVRRSPVMRLKLLNEQGQANRQVDAPDAVFARGLQRGAVHQVVVAYRVCQRPPGHPQAEGPRRSDRQVTSRSARRAPAAPAPAWPPRRCGVGRSHLPELPDENFTPEGQQEDVRAGAGAIRSQLAREGRSPWSCRSAVEAPKTANCRAEVQGHGPGLVKTLVIADGRRQPRCSLRGNPPGHVLVPGAALRRSASLVFSRRCW